MAEEDKIYDLEMKRLKRVQKSLDKQKKNWQKKVESTDWLKILSEKGADHDRRDKI